MEVILSVLIGVLFASSMYLLMKKSLVRIVLGVLIMSNAVNLLIFTMGRLTRGAPPLIESNATVAAQGIANPLPQALILTAIVIGFGLFAFSLVLIYRYFKESKNLDSDKMLDAEIPYDKVAISSEKGGE